jgi:hypothetical protein
MLRVGVTVSVSVLVGVFVTFISSVIWLAAAGYKKSNESFQSAYFYAQRV